jgi:hypothetical protein
MASSQGSSSMASMGGMEHPQDTLFVPPLVDPRVLMQFCRAVQQYADTIDRRAEADDKISELKARLKNLRDLASLCRLAVLGHPRSFDRVLDEMSCLAADFPDDPLDSAAGMELEAEDEPDDRFQFAAVIDLLAGAAFVSKDDPAQRDRLIVGIIRAVEDAICYPLAFSAEAAEYVGEGNGGLSQSHVSMAIGNATGRLIERDKSCDPSVAPDIRLRLEHLALEWMAANPVTEMFRALTGPRLTGALESIDPDDVGVGDRVTLTLKEDCASDAMKPGTVAPAALAASEAPAASRLGNDLYVLFCPAQPANVLKVTDKTLLVEVPKNARTGPIALVRTPALEDVKYLLKRYACEYPVEWFYSLFTVIGMGKWAYPVAFGPPLVEITQVPQDVTVTAHNSSGPVGVGKATPVNEPVVITYQVNPIGSDGNAPLQVNAPGGRVTQAKPGTVVYTPTQPGVNNVELSWGDLTTSVTVNASGGAVQRTQPKAKGAKKGGARDE